MMAQVGPRAAELWLVSLPKSVGGDLTNPAMVHVTTVKAIRMAFVQGNCNIDAWVRMAVLVAWVPGPSLGDPAGPYLATWAPMASELNEPGGSEFRRMSSPCCV